MRFVLSSALQFLWFGAVSWLMLGSSPDQPPAVVTLFVMGELGLSALLCSVIVRRYRQSTLHEWQSAAVVGYSVSHVAILSLLYFGPHAAALEPVHGLSTQVWMELNLQVSLLVVLGSTAAVLWKPRIRKFTEAHMRKFTAAA